MTDIAERLRKDVEDHGGRENVTTNSYLLEIEAADEIERLRQALDVCQNIARDALKPTP